MIDYINRELFKNSSTDKNLIITRQDDTVYDNDSIYQEQLEINESLCSTDSLQIGACEASSVKFKVRNDNYSWKGEKIKLSLVLDHDTEHPFNIGTYIVDSDTPTAEREWREVTAYDALFSILNTDYTNWYMELWANNSSMQLKEFRDRFFQNCGIEQEETALINDSVMTYQTVSESDSITGKIILNAICEMNGVFGHINRKGNFDYITLKPSIDKNYPSEDIYPSEDLYPSEPADVEPIYLDDYTYPLDYEDYIVGNFTELKIQETDSDEGTIVGVAGNRYTINGNFLLFGKPQEELQEIGTNILNTINAIMYRPIKTLNKLCNPCFEVGDKIMVYLNNGTVIESYILERTITGIQRLKDSYASKGTEEQIITGNTLQNQIDQLRGKAKDTDEVIEETQETIEETKETIEDLREETTVSLDKLDDRIVAEVTRASLAEGNLSSRITVAEGSIDLEVSRATNAENLLSSRISITESGISSKVSKGDVVSEINQSSDVISLSAGRLEITSGNLTLDRLGNASFSGNLNGATGSFSGSVTAKTGQIGDFLIKDGNLENPLGVKIQYANIFSPSITTEILRSDNTYTYSLASISNVLKIGKSSSSVELNGSVYLLNPSSSSATPNARIDSDGEIMVTTNESSRRFKHDISNLTSKDLSPEKLYDIDVMQFKYNNDMLSAEDYRYDKELIGFIAEDIFEKYPIAADIDNQGVVTGWNAHYIIPPMLALIQKQHEEIKRILKKLSLTEMEDGK